MTLILSGTDGLSDVDGTAATPALRGTDANTGIFFPAADTIGFAEGGAEVMRINSSGFVGIGTTNPGVKLDITNNSATAYNPATAAFNTILSLNNTTSGASNNALMSFTTESNGEWYIGGVENAGNNAADFIFASRASGARAERARIDSSGNLGIGTSSPSQKLTVAGAGTAARIEVINTSDSNRGGYLRDTGSAFELGTNSGVRPLAFAFDGSEKARIDSSGNLLVGTTAEPTSSVSGVKICNPGTVATSRWSRGTGTASTNMIAFANGNGDVGTISTSGSATTYSTSSDYRLKNTIAPMTGALAKVALLKPVTYKWNVDGSDGQGFIAHELDEVVQGCVTGTKDAVDAEGKPQYQGIDTSFLVATLTAAIQEQQALITQLQADVASLKGTTP